MGDKVYVQEKKLSFEEMKSEVLTDYKLACISREMSVLGRREVLTGKAKFGIFGDGKEVAQIALAKFFKAGDFRSGYYRDQTWMMAAGLLTIEQFFAQLYAHTDVTADPHSGGRQMNCHFATRSLNDDGTWKDLTKVKNSSADLSPTGSQMPRLLGLALASKHYRNNKALKDHAKGFSVNGNEVAWGAIGDASTSEGMFWEAVNAAGVLQVPMVISVWDDGYGISVPRQYQTTKGSISDVLSGFVADDRPGLTILKTKGWDYPNLIETYHQAEQLAREQHIPVLVHVEEVTQPQGHSTSGSHERYKSKERLQWEQDFDPIRQMRLWMIKNGIADEVVCEKIESEAKQLVKEGKKKAWDAYLGPIKSEIKELDQLLMGISLQDQNTQDRIAMLRESLKQSLDINRKTVLSIARRALYALRGTTPPGKEELLAWYKEQQVKNFDRYDRYLYTESDYNAEKINGVEVRYDDQASKVNGREILRDNFDILLKEHPELLIYGEDVGIIGGVNQGLEGMQARHGEGRVFDTGIRECTIIGQGIGLAMRGLRPIAEIQYLDYILYAIQILSDDLATLPYRTHGGQKAPLIIRTRGHRLEGIWHSGSHMGALLHLCRGIYLCVPRNLTQAAGFYNTLLASDSSAIIVESLNGYRLKEKRPSNLGRFRIPLGVPEILRDGKDVTLVTYGSVVHQAMDAAVILSEMGISVEVIDVQTLLPFDNPGMISKSLEKTNRIVFVDEDVPGGATSYMMKKVLEDQGGYRYLDAEPRTVTGKDHRPAYGTDGDYFSNPGIEDIVEACYELMHQTDPATFPDIML